MAKAVGIQFRSGIKIYDFKQPSSDIELNDQVLVETAYGEEVGVVKYTDREVKESKETPLKPITKILSDKDIERLARLKNENLNYIEIFRKKVEEQGLAMKFVDFEFSLDGEKVTFYFTAESRVDFRNLVREISRLVRKTVLLRQMGQRDEARLMEGYGACGRPICCRSFLSKMENISMDMVREQYEGNRNASKVSGCCGKLMCCLAFENGGKKGK